MSEINPSEVYTTLETQKLLKISNSTMKRMLKKGIIKAVKLGGRYRILGKEILNALSPEIEHKVADIYVRLKSQTKKAIKDW